MLHSKGYTKGACRPAHVISCISLAASWSFSSLREAMTTLQPRDTSSCAIARPSPVPPPVTIATFPENRSFLNTLLSDAIFYLARLLLHRPITHPQVHPVVYNRSCATGKSCFKYNGLSLTPPVTPSGVSFSLLLVPAS